MVLLSDLQQLINKNNKGSKCVRNPVYYWTQLNNNMSNKLFTIEQCLAKYKKLKKNSKRNISRRVWDKANLGNGISRRQIIKLFGSWFEFKSLAEKSNQIESKKDKKLQFVNFKKQK